MTYHGQWDEDKFVLQFFAGNNDGFFLDVGANDGISHSNTRTLWEQGWHGVLVEPNRHAFKKLLEAYPEGNRVVLVHAAICQTNGSVVFYENDISGWSSLDVRWVSMMKGFRERRVLGLRLDALGLPPLIDFLSIDTEGKDAEILENMPKNMAPRLIMAETDKFDSLVRIEKALTGRGYERVFSGKANAAYARIG